MKHQKVFGLLGIAALVGLTAAGMLAPAPANAAPAAKPTPTATPTPTPEPIKVRVEINLDPHASGTWVQIVSAKGICLPEEKGCVGGDNLLRYHRISKGTGWYRTSFFVPSWASSIRVGVSPEYWQGDWGSCGCLSFDGKTPWCGPRSRQGRANEVFYFNLNPCQGTTNGH